MHGFRFSCMRRFPRFTYSCKNQCLIFTSITKHTDNLEFVAQVPRKSFYMFDLIPEWEFVARFEIFYERCQCCTANNNTHFASNWFKPLKILMISIRAIIAETCYYFRISFQRILFSLLNVFLFYKFFN